MTSTKNEQTTQNKQPNILLITVDQMRYPCLRYQSGGMNPEINQILSFQPTDPSTNSFAKFFPGFLRLQQNAVVFDQHIIASSACVPSRATIYTGQYGTRTKVLETDSLYKSGSDPNFPWLHPRGIPTTGDWFRAAGYTTHYFGKWDLSYVDFDGYEHGDLNQWGFADWRLCPPDAQGGSLNELGVYRDPGYADLVSNFLTRQAMNYEQTPNAPKPFFCVASFVNPHDIASAYPMNWWVPDGLTTPTDKPVAGVQTATDSIPTIRPIPAEGDLSNPLPGGRLRVPLNPLGFPQHSCEIPVTLNEDLSTKPRCQFDYSYKMGLALKSRRPQNQWQYQTFPFQLQEHSKAWFGAYGDFYTYLHSLVDAQISKVLKTLDETGLAEDTIVVFLGDHGEYLGAHGGMIEKWHTAYEEILHVPFLVSSPVLNASTTPVRISQLTSHIDVLPTLLGLAGYDAVQRDELGRNIPGQTYLPLPGADLSPVIENPSQPVLGPDQQERTGVLFISDDTITQYLAGEEAPDAYHVFEQEVEILRTKGGLSLAPGSVTEPCHIYCARTTEWKLVKYWDPHNRAPNEWELYYLVEDNYELYNLVSWSNGQPIPEPGRIPTGWSLTSDQLTQALASMRELLVKLEETYLGGPRPVMEPYTFDG